MKGLRTGLVALGVVLAALHPAFGSEEEGREQCPSEREWGSVLDPENRPLLLNFAMGVVGGHSADGEDVSGIVYAERLYFLFIHSYQDTPDYRDMYSGLFEALRQNPVTLVHFGDAALRDMNACMTGGGAADCAKMALDKGYVAPLAELMSKPSLKEPLAFFKAFCEAD